MKFYHEIFNQYRLNLQKFKSKFYYQHLRALCEKKLWRKVATACVKYMSHLLKADAKNLEHSAPISRHVFVWSGDFDYPT